MKIFLWIYPVNILINGNKSASSFHGYRVAVDEHTGVAAHFTVSRVTLTGGSPCSGGRSTPRWGSPGAAGSGSGCGRTRGTSRSTAALRHPCTPGRTPCGGRPPPSPRRRRCPPPPLSPPPEPPTGCPPSPGSQREHRKQKYSFIA